MSSDHYCDCRMYDDPIETLCSWCRDRRIDWERDKEEEREEMERIMREEQDLEGDVHDQQ